VTAGFRNVHAMQLHRASRYADAKDTQRLDKPQVERARFLEIGLPLPQSFSEGTQFVPVHSTVQKP